MRSAPYSLTRNFNEPWTRINVEIMKDQRTGTKNKEHSQTWMRKTKQLHMDKVDHCKEDGFHMVSLF